LPLWEGVRRHPWLRQPPWEVAAAISKNKWIHFEGLEKCHTGHDPPSIVEHDQDNNDDESSLGFFSELYSENPTPVDPNGSPASGERQLDTTLQEPTDQNSHRHHRHSPHDVDPSSRAHRMMSQELRNDSLTLSPARRSLSSRRSSTEWPRATGWT
jgi:hypothetical protein